MRLVYPWAGYLVIQLNSMIVTGTSSDRMDPLAVIGVYKRYLTGKLAGQTLSPQFYIRHIYILQETIHAQDLQYATKPC